MADSVYYHLERMLPELDDLQQRGLFSASEIKDIAKRRREFEFRLERRAKLKGDYLRYIEYELQLEKLRKLRKKALIRASISDYNINKDDTGIKSKSTREERKKWKSSLCDRASSMRIMLIYERAVTRFKGDLELWMRYLEYCRSQGTRRMQKVLIKALRLHPTVPGLWIYAAAWEFDHNMNITAARALMQRGLRMCPQSEKLWLEYFRMELVFVDRLRLNKSAANLGRIESRSDSTYVSDEDVEAFAVRGGTIGGKNVDFETHPAMQEFAGSNLQPEELAYKLAKAIYKNAFTAVPSSLEFRQRFVELLQQAGFKQAQALKDEIFSSLKNDFALDTHCWDWLARIDFETTGAMDQAVEVYENALTAVPSGHMYELYAKFLEELLVLKCQESQGNSSFVETSGEESIKIANKLLELYERAHKSALGNAFLAEHHAALLLRLGKVDSAMKLLEELCCGVLKSCGCLWAMRLLLEMKKQSSAQTVADLCQQSLRQLQLTEAKDVWPMVLEYFAGQSTTHAWIIELFIQKTISSDRDHTIDELACLLVDWILSSEDISQARKLYRRLFELSCLGVKVYKHCIQIESHMVAMGCKDAVHPLRKLFQSALDKHSQDSELWLEYYYQEINLGDPESAGNIYWRAKKVLDNPSYFLEGHQHSLSKKSQHHSVK